MNDDTPDLTPLPPEWTAPGPDADYGAAAVVMLCAALVIAGLATFQWWGWRAGLACLGCFLAGLVAGTGAKKAAREREARR